MRSILRTIALAGMLCALCLSAAASSAPDTPAANLSGSSETLYSAEYCFAEADFHADTLADLRGIFVTGVPDAAVATVQLGQREILPGDVLPLAPRPGGDADHPHQVREERNSHRHRRRI